jgi:hypothetical protein
MEEVAMVGLWHGSGMWLWLKINGTLMRNISFWWHFSFFSCDSSFASFALGTHDCGIFFCIFMLVFNPFSPFSHLLLHP